MRHTNTASETLVEVFYTAASHLHNVEFARARRHLRLDFKLRSKRALQLFVEHQGLLWQADTNSRTSSTHVS
jgi:hypothetical protein